MADPAPITVLLVDDEETLRIYFHRVLGRHGFNVVVAGDGQEAIEIFEKESRSVDCVLMDFKMPGMNGEATFRELRRIASDVRVIFLSALLAGDALGRLNAAGMSGYLQKPVNVDALVAEVRRVVGQK